ncbi:MAG TPA: glycosyltransferase [Gemmatimonadales bacterium]|nr:glycosyltransferase [Gemmatimonadales bacterium]
MRILLLNYEYPPLGGGAGIATAALAEELVDRGDRVDVVTSHPGGDDRACLRPRPGLAVHRVRAWRKGVHQAGMMGAGSYVLTAAPLLHRLLSRGRYDVAHLFFSLPTGLLLPLCRRHAIPTIVSLRGSDVPGYDPYNRGLQRIHRLLRPVTRSVWRRAGRVVAVCESLGRLARRTEPRLCVTAVPNGVDVRLFRPPEAPRPVQGPVRCIAVARLVERKGLGDLVEALARLERGYYRLEIVGSGPDERMLRERADRLGVGREIEFTGALDHAAVAERLRRADLFTLPSREEAFGNAFAEALAAGLPIVGTAVGGIPELVTPGENGLLVRPGDAAALAAAIRRLGDDPGLRASMGARNRARALATLSWPAVAARYATIYAELAGHPLPLPVEPPQAVA